MGLKQATNMARAMVRVRQLMKADSPVKFGMAKRKTAVQANLHLGLRNLESLERDGDASTGYEGWREKAVAEAYWSEMWVGDVARIRWSRPPWPCQKNTPAGGVGSKCQVWAVGKHLLTHKSSSKW